MKALYGAGVVFFLLPIFLFGKINELRIFNELIPLGALAAGFVLGRFLEPGTARTEPA